MCLLLDLGNIECSGRRHRGIGLFTTILKINVDSFVSGSKEVVRGKILIKTVLRNCNISFKPTMEIGKRKVDVTNVITNIVNTRQLWGISPVFQDWQIPYYLGKKKKYEKRISTKLNNIQFWLESL